MGKPKYWSTGHGRTASNAKLKNHNTNNNGFDHHYNEASSTSAGCMCAVFQLFDFHPNLNHHQQPPQSSPVSLKPISKPLDHHIISKGTEAPRNSLESDEESPLSCTPKQKVQDGLHFPKGIVQIKTKLGSSSPLNSNNCSSPSIKTPTLVARLMGLDLLPQSNINSPSTTPKKANNNNNYPLLTLQKPKNGGSRSLPETPRTSCEKKSNLENYHHRLSLQIPNYDKENASPSHYAKEIVKQIKETVGRKAGLNDITNYTRRDQDVINQTKPKRVLSSTSTSSSTLACSSVSREVKNLSKASPKMKTKKKATALKKEAFVASSRITKAAIIEKPVKKCKKTPLSSELLSLSSVPTVGVKKLGPPFSSPTKQSTTTMKSQCNENEGAVETEDKESKRKKLQQHTCHPQPHIIPIINHHTHVVVQSKSPKHHITTAAAAADRHHVSAELDYVRQILLRRTNAANSVHFLENCTTVPFPHKKLLSHLVEELLAPYVETRPYRKTAAERWPEVVEKLCERVRAFPRAKCEVLEDIDGIIEKDLGILGIGFEDEIEGIVKEIEECVFEELLNETVRFIHEI